MHSHRLRTPGLLRLALALSLVGTLGSDARAAAQAPAMGTRGMVVSTQADAARAGRAILERGGNAVDAAIATAFAVGVSQPFSAGLGGGAFLLIRLADGEVVALDARETAPLAASRDMYLQPGVPERASLIGPLAVATPGFVAGCALALERWGTLSLPEVLAPAIALAEDGFAIGAYHARMLERMRGYQLPERFPETGRIQFPPAGEPARPGWVLRQPELAETLRRIAAEGPELFYRGELAHAIVATVSAAGGMLAWEDLSNYQPVLRQPIQGRYRDHAVYSFPPPSSGGIALVEALNILEGFELRPLGAGSSASLHRIAEALKLAFADRAAFLGDPDFVAVPTEALIAKSYADTLRSRINPSWWRRAPWSWAAGESAIQVEGPGLPQDDSGTTHLSTSDAAGNAVALTMTINTPFGSGITVPGTGIVLNNEMDDFSIAPDTPNAYGLVDTRGSNAIAAGKRPLSSMTPSILLRDDRLFMVSGSPGGPRIISTTLLTLLNVIDFEMNVQQAVAAPRFHHQWVPDKLFVEPETPADVVEGLRERGHDVEVSKRNWSAAEAIVVDADGIHWGGADPRTQGLAAGF